MTVESFLKTYFAIGVVVSALTLFLLRLVANDPVPDDPQGRTFWQLIKQGGLIQAFITGMFLWPLMALLDVVLILLTIRFYF